MKRLNLFGCLLGFLILTGSNVCGQNTIEEAIRQVRSITDADPFVQNARRAEEAKRIIMARIRTTNPNLSDPPQFKALNDEMDLLRDGDPAKGRKAASGDELLNWTWENKAGRCAEQVYMMKKLLDGAGVKVTILTAGNHVFPVVNMADGASVDIPWSWGPHAIVPDTWLGRTLRPEDSWNEPFHFDGGKKNAGDAGAGKSTFEYLEIIGDRFRTNPKVVDFNCKVTMQSGKAIVLDYRKMLNDYYKIPERYRQDLAFKPMEEDAIRGGKVELEEIRKSIDQMSKNDSDQITKIRAWISDLEARFEPVSRCHEGAKLFRKEITASYKLLAKQGTDATTGIADVEPTDEVPDDIKTGTGQVKVIQYFVFLLTNSSNGLYVGSEDSLKGTVRCGYEGGGIGCKPTDVITYRKLTGPFASQAEAQASLCQNITESRIFPIGVGLKGRWQGGSNWYGLWNASLSGCSK